MNYQEQRPYVGNLRQLFGLRESRLAGGKADGVRIVDIHNGGDLALCVAADRCMDIPEVRYRGRVLNYITPNGIVHPSYYSCYGEGWSEAFAGGLAAVLRGVMREGMLAGVDLWLTRIIRVEYLRNVIEVTDTVRNDGYRTAPHLLLYHCNLGYPLLQPDSRLRIPNQGVRPRTPFAKTMLPELDTILPPQDAMEEMCYYYTTAPDENGWEHVRLENRRERLGLTLSFDASTLGHFVQWKNFVKGEYVMGLEPANCTIDGRSDAIARGQMQQLEPGQSRIYRLRFCFDDAQEA